MKRLARKFLQGCTNIVSLESDFKKKNVDVKSLTLLGSQKTTEPRHATYVAFAIKTIKE